MTARRRRTIAAVAASAAAHAALLTVLALQTSVLRTPPPESGPPEAVIPILIMPRAPPPQVGSAARPAPIRLHRRAQRTPPGELPVRPLTAPIPTPAAPSQAPAPVRPSPMPEGPKGDLRAALRRVVGCTNIDAVGLTPAERADCLERFGRGAKDADDLPPGVGLSRAKRAILDQAAAAKDARKAAMERAPAPDSPSSQPEPQDYDGEPYITGSGQSALGPISHPASKRAARQLGRLPP